MTSVDIEELLTQSGMEDDARLHALLSDIEALGAGEAPAPSPEVLALMAPAARVQRARVRSGHRKAIIITLAVAASLGLGATAAAAAIPEVRSAAQNVVAVIVHALVPDRGVPVAPSGAPSRSGIPASTPHSSKPTDAPGRSGETKSTSAPRSTVAPRATTVPANPHATAAPTVPPARNPQGGNVPPARSRSH